MFNIPKLITITIASKQLYPTKDYNGCSKSYVKRLGKSLVAIPSSLCNTTIK